MSATAKATISRGYSLRWLVLVLSLTLVSVGLLRPDPACAFWPLSLFEEAEEQPPRPDDAQLLYQQITRLSADLFRSLEEPDMEYSELRGGVIVLSFVEQKNLTRTSSLGRYLAEQLMNELQLRRVPVVEVRKSREVRIQQSRGEYGLSRDAAEINDEAAAAAMLTGTYTVTPEQVIVSARIIDNRTAVLLASATSIIPRTQTVETLLSDPVGLAAAVKPEPMYMKRLGL